MENVPADQEGGDDRSKDSSHGPAPFFAKSSLDSDALGLQIPSESFRAHPSTGNDVINPLIQSKQGAPT